MHIREGQPDAAALVLPNGEAQGQLHGDALIPLHQLCTHGRRAEHDYPRRAQSQVHFPGIQSVIETGEHGNVPLPQLPLDPLHGLVDVIHALVELQVSIIVSRAQRIPERSGDFTPEIAEIHAFPVAQQGYADQFRGIGKTAEKGRESRHAALDVHEPAMLVELPTHHGRNFPAGFQGERTVENGPVFRFFHQNGARKADIPETDVLRRSPQIRKPLQRRGAHHRHGFAVGIVSRRRFGRIHVDLVRFEQGVQIAGGGDVLLVQAGKILEKTGVFQAQILDLMPGDEVMVRHAARLLHSLRQQQKIGRALLHVRIRLEFPGKIPGHGQQLRGRVFSGRVVSLMQTVIRDTGSMTHQLQHGAFRPIPGKTFDIPPDAVVKLEFAPFVQLHHGHGGVRLGNRPDGPDRAGGSQTFFPHVRKPVPHHAGNIGGLHDGESQAGNMFFFPDHPVNGFSQIGNIRAAPAFGRPFFLYVHNNNLSLCDVYVRALP